MASLLKPTLRAMIIKSMSRKAPTFQQLAHYINRDAEGHVQIAHNLPYAGRDPDLVAAQFQQNYRYLPPRRNGNALYHLVLVLPAQPQMERKALQPVLQQLGQELCNRFAPDQLAWGRAHYNTDHPHIHLMVSANDARGTSRRRLTKQSFASLQRDMEAYKASRFPELVGIDVYRKQASQDRARVRAAEGELIRRTKTPSAKQRLREQVYQIMRQSQDRSALETHFKANGLELYQRGESWGLHDLTSGRRFRFRTLGLEPELQVILARKASEAPQRKVEAKPDPRAQQLLESRANLERITREELGRFDRGDER